MKNRQTRQHLYYIVNFSGSSTQNKSYYRILTTTNWVRQFCRNQLSLTVQGKRKKRIHCCITIQIYKQLYSFLDFLFDLNQFIVTGKKCVKVSKLFAVLTSLITKPIKNSSLKKKCFEISLQEAQPLQKSGCVLLFTILLTDVKR